MALNISEFWRKSKETDSKFEFQTPYPWKTNGTFYRRATFSKFFCQKKIQ